MRFPLPLRYTIPVALLLFGLFLGGLSFAYEVTSSYRRIEQDIYRRAVFLGNQISEMLRYHFQNGDVDAADRQIRLLGANPNLRFAIVCNETNRVLFSSRNELRDQVASQLPELVANDALETARQKMTAQFGFNEKREALFAALPFAMPPDTDNLQFAGAGVLYFEYDLTALKQNELVDVRLRSSVIGGVLALICLAVWLL